MALGRIRIWQNVCLTCQNDCYTRKEIENKPYSPPNSERSFQTQGSKKVKNKKKSAGDKVLEEETSLRNYQESVSLLSTTFNMDQIFKLATITAEIKREKLGNKSAKFDKFRDEISQASELERLMAEAPPVPLVKPLE
jgi:hypothetical protein